VVDEEDDEDPEGRTSTGRSESELELDVVDGVLEAVVLEPALDDVEAESLESRGAARFSFGRSSSPLSLVELELDDELSRREEVLDPLLEFAVSLNATFAAR
jgi:hypothetical protein